MASTEKRRKSSFRITNPSHWHNSFATITVMRGGADDASVLHFNPQRGGYAYQNIPVAKRIERTVSLQNFIVGEADRLHLVGSGKKYNVVIILAPESYDNLYDVRGE